MQIQLVNSTGDTLPVSDDVVVERLWDDGAPVNKTTIKLNKGFGIYTYTPDVAHTNSTLNLVVSYQSYKICYNKEKNITSNIKILYNVLNLN